MEREDYREFKQSKIALFSRLKPRNIFPGEWESVYTGDGIEFASIEPFEPGDDLRNLDLHALVQSGEEQTVHRVTGRQVRIFVWVDFSGSMQRFDEMLFAGKPEIRDIAIGLLLFSALHVYSPVGLCAFDGRIRRFFPARSGERHCWEMLDWVTAQGHAYTRTAANYRNATGFLMERVLARSLVFLVSDFQDAAFEPDFTDLLAPVAKKFDLVPVVIRDPLEKHATLRRSVQLAVSDCEGETGAEIRLTPQGLREIQQVSERHLLHLGESFRALGIGHVVLDSTSVEDCHRVFAGFFQARTLTR